MTDSLHLVFGFLFLVIVFCGFVAMAMMETSSSRRRESVFVKNCSLPVFESERVVDEEKEEKKAKHKDSLIVEADVSPPSEPEMPMPVVDRPRRIVSTVRPGGKTSQAKEETGVVAPKAGAIDFVRAEELMEKGAGFSRILGRNLENILIQSTEEGMQAVAEAIRGEVSEAHHAKVSAVATEASQKLVEAAMARRAEREAAEKRRFLRDWDEAIRENAERKFATKAELISNLRWKLGISGSFDPIRAEEFARKTEPGHRTNDPVAQQNLRKKMRGTTGGGNNRQGQKKNKGEKNKKDGKWK